MSVKTIKHLAYLLQCNSSPTELQTICRELMSFDIHLDGKYYRKLVEKTIKKNGKVKERIIYPAIGRLKIIQASIHSFLLSNIQLPEYITGGVKKNSNISNASLHKYNRYKFTTDIKMFFPSVTSEMVYKALTRHNFSPDVARVLTQLCTYKGMLPQGAPSSTTIANIVFMPIDEQIGSLCKGLRQIVYSRFVDDLTISASEDFQYLIPRILSTITEAGFRISHKKTFYKGQLEVTGVVVGYNLLSPTENFKERLSQQNQTIKELSGRKIYLERILRENRKSAKVSV